MVLVLKTWGLSRVVPAGGEGECVVTYSDKSVHSYKESLCLWQEHQVFIQQIFIEHLRGTDMHDQLQK
jgi:hypothetical protein